MYKIYINEIPVFLISSEKINDDWELTNSSYLVRYSGKVKHLLNYIDMCEKNPNIDKVIIYYDDFKVLKKDFKSIYTQIEASGGLIRNEYNEFLFIFRRGFWDLPKGKIEKLETKKKAAIREVIEETGINSVILESKICETLHTFKNRLGNRNIKKSYWYLMTTHKQDLIPQKEEDISKAEWITLNDFLDKYKPVYASILDVIHDYQQNILSTSNV